MKAIETWYDGIRFRSRAEAREAVFLNHIGVNWRYEHQGFADDDVAYLPDFWLPDLHVFLEVKGEYPDHEAIAKAEALAATNYHAVFIDYGDTTLQPMLRQNDSMLCVGAAGFVDSQYWWCECPYCGLMGIQFQGRADRLPCGCCVERDNLREQTHDSQKLLEAYEAARSARFDGKLSRALAKAVGR